MPIVYNSSSIAPAYSNSGGNVYTSFSLDETGGGLKVNYSKPFIGLYLAIYDKEQDYLYRRIIDQYTQEILYSYPNKSKDAVTVIIMNRVDLSSTSENSFQQYLYKKLGKDSNYDFSNKTTIDKWSKYLSSFDSFLKNTAISKEYIKNEVIEYLGTTLLPDETTIPTAAELKARSAEKDKADIETLAIKKASEGTSNTTTTTTNNYTKYIIIAALAVGAYLIYKKNK